MKIEQTSWADPDAAALRAQQRAEIAQRYGTPDSEPGTPPSAVDITVFFVARDGDGTAVGCGGLRRLGDGVGEIKRMYVAPERRGSGVALSILRTLEDWAREQGWTSLRLETGDAQPDAVRFYTRAGYGRIPNFGAYVGAERSLCFERALSETITATAAGTWKLGDLTVNRIGFGTMRLTQYGAAFNTESVPSDRGRALSVLRRAVELGVNHIDTASFYFSRLRSANELVNSALAPYPDDLVITTKVGPGRDPHGDWTNPATRAQLRGQVEENLRQLGRDHLDVVNYRRQRPGSIAEHFGALAELREAGLIRHLGLSGVGPEHLAEAQAIAPVVCVQNRYGLGVGTPESDALLRSCGEQGIAFVPFFAIAGQGGERGAAGAAEDAEVLAVATAHGVSAPEIRLAWSLHQGPHVLAIPGTGNLAHLEANVAAGALRLSDDELARLDAVHRA